MKIIYEGNNVYVDDFGGEVDCSKCGSTLKYSQEDVKYYESSTRVSSGSINNNNFLGVSGPISYNYIICPKCGNVIKVHKKSWLEKKIEINALINSMKPGKQKEKLKEK